MVYGEWGMGVAEWAWKWGKDATQPPQVSNEMYLLDGGEFFQRGFNQFHSRFYVFVAGIETKTEANGGFRLVAGKSNGLEYMGRLRRT